MALILDVLVVAIVIYVIYSNAKRGFGKVLVFGIGYVVATLLASAISTIGAPAFYEGVAREANISAVESVNERVNFGQIFTDAINESDLGVRLNGSKVRNQLEDYSNGDFDERLYNYMQSEGGDILVNREQFRELLTKAFIRGYGEKLQEWLPEYVHSAFEKRAKEDPQFMRDMVREFYDDRQSAGERAEKLEDLFSADITTEMIQIFMYLILFSLFMVFAAIIASLVQQKIFFNIKSTTDHVAGAFIGILEAGSMLVLLTLIVRLLVILGAGKFMFFNDSQIENTFLFSILYRNIRLLL